MWPFQHEGLGDGWAPYVVPLGFKSRCISEQERNSVDDYDIALEVTEEVISLRS